MPLEVQGHTVPHLKALRYGKYVPKGLSWITTLMPVWGSWKMGIYYINGALSKLNCYELYIFLMIIGCLSSHRYYKWSRIPNSNKVLSKSMCKTPKDGSHLLPHPSDNTKYIICNNGWPFLMHCPRGTKFNVKLKICFFKSKIRYPLRYICIKIFKRENSN